MPPQADDNERGRAFIRLLSQHERRLNAYIASLVANWSDADDILQETKVRLWEQFGDYDPAGDFGVWARRIAFYQVLTYRKKATRDRIRFSQKTLELVAEELSTMSNEADSRHCALAHCLGKLTEAGRQLLWYFYASGGTIKDMAISLGRSVRGTQRAVAKIRSELQQCVERRVRAEEYP